ncbi:MAG: carboxyl-terminal processing protease [Patescibacteria group bacterium]|nr:carboxyl-terminal processing protease [Patescibacteria group bacterium]
MNKYKNKILYTVYFLAISIGIFTFGVYVGFSERPAIDKITNIKNTVNTQATVTDFDPYWKVWNVLSNKSIKAKEVTDQERLWGSIQGLASSFNDPYTVFFPPEENKLFNDTIKGSFSGIGAEVGLKNKLITIISPLKDSPSFKAGLLSGDVIVKIDGKETKNMSIDAAINLIRGQKGTIVELTIFRSGEKKTRNLSIVRDTVEIPTIETEMRKDGIFVIRFFSFSENSGNLFNDALKEFTKSKSDKLILDLRGNPGGYLSVAVEIASNFIAEGKTIAIEDFGNSRDQEIYRSYGSNTLKDIPKFVILVDGGSASASEILAGALKEHKVATIVGSTTFGKGSVQELVRITDDTSLKVTIAKWLTPNGLSISDHGLEPDVKVNFTEKDIENKNDPQLEKAVEILNK